VARVKLQLPESFSFQTEIPIRISDINYGGHLGNDAVLSIAHEARIRFFKSIHYTELDIEGTGILMTDAVVVYTSEGMYGDVLTILVTAADPQTSSCDILYKFINTSTGKEIARVKTGIVFVDRSKKKIVPIPLEFITKCFGNDKSS